MQFFWARAVFLIDQGAALGGFRFYCELLVLRYWSATTLSATNLAAHSVIILIAIPAFHSAVSPLLLLGTALTIFASVAYAWRRISSQAKEDRGSLAHAGQLSNLSGYDTRSCTASAAADGCQLHARPPSPSGSDAGSCTTSIAAAQHGGRYARARLDSDVDLGDGRPPQQQR